MKTEFRVADRKNVMYVTKSAESVTPLNQQELSLSEFEEHRTAWWNVLTS